MIPNINVANHAPGVQIDHVLAVICSHRLIFKKKNEKLSETMKQYNILTNQLMQYKVMLHACCLLFVFFI